MSGAAPSFASASDLQEQVPQVRELASGTYGYISAFDPNCGFVVGDLIFDDVRLDIGRDLQCERPARPRSRLRPNDTLVIK